jgi:hypothetical protein
MDGRRYLAAIATACAALAVVPGVASAGMLDQQQTATSAGGGLGVASIQTAAQTFTAGITGDLDGIDLYLSKADATVTDPVTVEIRNASPGFMGTTVLAGASIPASAVPIVTPSWIATTFATPVPVTAGSHYAILAYTNAAVPKDYGWHGMASDVYAGGTALLSPASPPLFTWLPQEDRDQAFRTYVVPAPGSTPPPTTAPPAAPPVASGASGLGAQGKCKKKSKKARKKCKKRAG